MALRAGGGEQRMLWPQLLRSFHDLQLARLGTPLLIVVTIAATLSTLYPRLDWENTEIQAKAYAVNRAADLITTFSLPGPVGVQIINVPLTWSSSARVEVRITDQEPPAGVTQRGPTSHVKGYWLEATRASFSVNADAIIFAFSFIVITYAALRLLQKPRTGVGGPVPIPGTGPAGVALLNSAEAYLVKDVERSLERSEELFSRSTLLLVGGVVMAFVGVGVFFVALSDIGNVGTVTLGPVSASVPIPTPSTESGFLGIPGRQLFQAFKSTAMLVFIEAIAWFLLRQYRALIEDYKSFYRYYMRRANYLTVLKLVSDRSDAALQARFVETLLAEDLSGRLKQGETTEVLEGQRMIDGNFAETLVARSAEIAQRAVGQERKTG